MLTISCKWCKEEFKVTASQLPRKKYCSKPCANLGFRKSEEHKKNKRNLWLQKNTKRLKKYQDNRYLEKKESILKKNKEYYLNNKETINLRNKGWREKNIKKMKEYFKQYSIDNAERKRKVGQIYRARLEIRERTRLQRRRKVATDPLFKISRLLRKRIAAGIKYHRGEKAYKTIELLGCSIEIARKHIESQFKKGMTWENWTRIDFNKNTWNIDHIIPIDSFNLLNPEDQKRAFHYTNLQPLWAIDNLKKGNKIL